MFTSILFSFFAFFTNSQLLFDCLIFAMSITSSTFGRPFILTGYRSVPNYCIAVIFLYLFDNFDESTIIGSGCPLASFLYLFKIPLMFVLPFVPLPWLFYMCFCFHLSIYLIFICRQVFSTFSFCLSYYTLLLNTQKSGSAYLFFLFFFLLHSLVWICHCLSACSSSNRGSTSSLSFPFNIIVYILKQVCATQIDL